MGKSGLANECKRHPNHNFLPGICPSCLRERLQQFNQFSNSNSNSITFSSSSSSTEFFFSSESPRRYRHRRNASEFVTGSGSISNTLFGDKLKKSGSIGFEAPAKKKDGFWSKLLRPKMFYFHSNPKVSREIIMG